MAPKKVRIATMTEITKMNGANTANCPTPTIPNKTTNRVRTTQVIMPFKMANKIFTIILFLN